MPTHAIIQTSQKKVRKPQARTMPIRTAIATIVDEYERMSVRQLFYQLVARREIEKTESAYKRVCDISAQMRFDGTLPYRKIVDGHRTRRYAATYSDMHEAIEHAHEFYRRDYWLHQPTNVEIWCEKDALSGVIQPTCSEYGVTYVATRGFPSITLIYESAIALAELNKPTHIYYFGDHDASGRAISQRLEVDLRDHGADVRVMRMALEPEQIDQYNLPTRPGKQTDTRYAKFTERYGDACVELDALPPDILTSYVRWCITREIDNREWRVAQQIEALERETLDNAKTLYRRLQPGEVYQLNGA